MNTRDLVNSKKLQLIIVILLLIIISIPIYIGLTELLSPSISENEYSVDYTDEGLVIYQHSGIGIDEELQLKITYDDGFEQNESALLHGEGDNVFISLSERGDNYIENVELFINYSGERMILYELGSQIESIEEFTVSDMSISGEEDTVISAEDYISNTDMIESYTWEFDDGITLYGESISRDFSGKSEYNVNLIVSDRFNNTEQDSFNINIEDKSNILSSNPSIQLEPDEELSLSGENSISQDSDDIISYSWDFEDGTIQEGEFVNHSFSEQGTYNITLTTEDIDGNIHSETIQVDVLSDVFSTFEVVEEDGFSYTFDASNSEYDTDVTYEWNFGDGNSKNTTDSVVSHTYEEANTYPVSLRIMSEDGVDSIYELDVTTTITIEFDDGTPYRVVDVNDGYDDVVLPNHDLGDDWPEIVFIEDIRYKFVNLPTQIEFISENENVLLSQIDTAIYENDSDVDWVDEGDSVEFTVTSELGEELYGYQTYG